MPFAFIVLGLIMIVTGARNTFRQFGSQVASDFTGPGNFTWWLASLGAVGAVGYVPKLRPVSVAFMTLILVVLVVSAKGLFPKLTEALQSGPKAPSAAPLAPSGASALSLFGSAAGGVSSLIMPGKVDTSIFGSGTYSDRLLGK